MTGGPIEHVEHHLPTNLYFAIFGALMALTAMTVGLAYVNLGQLNIVVALAVAILKASLVVMFFMHLKYEQRWWAGFVLFPLLLVMIIIGSNLPDTALNGSDKNKDDGLLSPPEAVIKHAGKAAPAGKH